METHDINEFSKKLLIEDNPFQYPDPPPRPPFMIGGEEYLRWFKDTYNHSIKHGYNVSFIVGDPGAGKSHLLRHLDYLFYVTESFKGIYTIYHARHEEIEEKDLWIQLFFNDDAIQKLHQILSIIKIQASKIRQDVKSNILKLMEGALQINSLDGKMLHDMAEGLSELLVNENAGMCIAIDNVDEHLGVYLSGKYGKEKALERFFGVIRSLTTGLKQIVVLLACTTPVYKEIKTVTVDRTHARRIEFQEETLKELTLSQSFELVHRYLEWWSKRHGMSLPLEPECTTPIGQVSVYPFSQTAIEYFHKVTGQYAGDIVLVCCECINDMKSEGSVSIVKDEVIIYALEKAQKKRPQIISKVDILKSDRAKILEKLMAKKLREMERRIRGKYVIGIEPTTIISRVEAFVDTLGVKVSEAPQVRNYYNPAQWIVPDESLKIWHYKDKRVAVEYIIGNRPPIGPKDRQTYGRSINLQDIFNVGSLIEAGEASHALLLLYWAGGYDTPTHKVFEQKAKFGPILEEISLDDTLFKIIGVVEEGGEDKKDLVEHVDKFYLKLIESLDRLIQQERPPEKRKREEFPPTRYY